MDDVWIEGHRIVLADGRNTLTVNVCRSDTPGDYRQVYRSNQPTNWVRAGGLIRIQSLAELERHLLILGFETEGGRA
ncbi:MAG TPA: hypothetical protein VG097_04025 [Gemmata sp.]|jgi:hypothetical protein|nr:hypothetical protein [Gemmata sp.]